jgi:hypothetical protein
MVEGGEGVDVCFRIYLGTEKVRLLMGEINAFLMSIKIINIRKTCFFFNFNDRYDLCNGYVLEKTSISF